MQLYKLACRIICISITWDTIDTLLRGLWEWQSKHSSQCHTLTCMRGNEGRIDWILAHIWHIFFTHHLICHLLLLISVKTSLKLWWVLKKVLFRGNAFFSNQHCMGYYTLSVYPHVVTESTLFTTYAGVCVHVFVCRQCVTDYCRTDWEVEQSSISLSNLSATQSDFLVHRSSTVMIEKLISHLSHPLKQHTAPSVTPPLMVPPLRRQRELCLATLQQSRERIIR